MNKRRGVIPNDISSSREYFGLNNSQDIYKGTSFKYSGEWMPNTHYFNDEYIIDFVTYDGKLWACSRNHLSSMDSSNAPSEKSRYWDLALEGVPGSSPEFQVITNDDGSQHIAYRLISPYGEEGDWKEIVDMSNLKGEKGDSRIYIGNDAEEASNYPIWFDTTEEEDGVLTPIDIVYQAYKETGGTMSKDEFYKSFASLFTTAPCECENKPGFEIREVDSLPENPTEDMVGYIYVIKSDRDGDDAYDEYTLIKSATTGDVDEYKWEKISGGEGANIDLSEYSTTQEVLNIIQDKMDNEEISSTN